MKAVDSSILVLDEFTPIDWHCKFEMKSVGEKILKDIAAKMR